MKKLLLIIIILIMIPLCGCQRNNNSQQILLFNDNRLCLQQNQKWGYYNQKGKKVIDFIYDDAAPFYNGIATVKKNERYFLIDIDGNKVIDETFDYLSIDQETGLIWYYENGLMGLMNRKGKKITELIFDSDNNPQFINHYAKVSVAGKYGFIDKKGKFIIEPEYDNAGFFHYGIARVVKENLVGYIDKNNNLVIDFEYDDGHDFTLSGFVAVKKDNKFYVLNRRGDIIVSDLDNCSLTNNYIFGEKDQKYLLYDLNGNQINSFVIDKKPNVEVEILNTQIIVIEYLDNTIEGKMINSEMKKLFGFSTPIDSDSKKINYYIENHQVHFIFQENETLKIVNELGEYIIEQECNYQSYYQGFFVVRRMMKKGVLNNTGEVILDIEYDNIELCSDGIAVNDNGKFGFYDYQGKLILPFAFESYKKRDFTVTKSSHLLP